MKKLSLLLGLFFCIETHAAFPVIKDYSSLVASLNSGEYIRGIVVQFQKCQLHSSLNTDEIKRFHARLQSMGFNFSTYNHFFASSNDDAIDEVEVSKDFFAITEGSSFGMAYHYIRFNFSSPNQVRISYNILGIDRVIKYTLDFTCTFGIEPGSEVFLYRIISNGTVNPVSANIESTVGSEAHEPLSSE